MMLRLCENSKVKRVLSCLILFSMVLTSFITSTTETVYADSNSRRRTSINLAAGSSFGEISNFEDIDEVSLQTIAIYLSNFYLPFVTILDGDYSDEDLEDSGNSQHVEAMKQALIRNCGFKKDVAEKLVSYVLAQSLSSCKTVYMKKTDLSTCFSLSADANGVSYLGFNNAQVYSGAYEPSGSHNGQEATAMASTHWYDSSIHYTSTKKTTDGNVSYEWDYITAAEVVTAEGVEYVPVSYAILLGVMANLYKSTSNGRIYKFSGTLGEIEFYAMTTVQGSITMKPVFSNSEDCTMMLLHAFQYCDNANGFSNGFMSISSTDVESIKNPDILQYAVVTCPNVYVNWEGSLIFDNGVYRTVILPGCMNPYMVETWNGSAYVPRLNFINNTSLSSIGMGAMTPYYTITMARSCYWNWRVTMGSDQTNFDQGWINSWGENEAIFELLQSINYVQAKGQGGGDYARLPVLTARLYHDKCWTAPGNKFGAYQYASVHSDWREKTSVNIVWYDSFSPVTADTPLSSMFRQQDVFDSDFIKTLKDLNIDTYAQFKNIKKQGHSLEYPKSTRQLFQSMYLTYCFAAFNAEYTTYDQDVNIVPIKLNLANFPDADIEIDFSAEQQDILGEQIMSFVYYLLHPTEGVAYVTRLFKNKVSGILLGWHEDIVGGTSSNAATGMTKYLGTSSYTTMPSLKDISWVSGILNIYNNIIVYLIILMCLILLCYVLTGSMTIQRGIVGVVLFGICAFLPPIAINGAVDVINTTSDTIFSKKFDFWAICQMQNFVDNYQDAMEAQDSGAFGSYAAFVISNASSNIASLDEDEESSVSFSGTKVKWMAPKKYNSLASLVQAANEGSAMGNSSASFLRNSLLNMVAKSTSGETFLSDTDSLYLYRDYSDIFKYAHTSYNLLGTFNYKNKLGTDDGLGNWTRSGKPLSFYIQSSNSSSYVKAFEGISNAAYHDVYKFVESNISNTLTDTVSSETSSIAHISKGYLFNTMGVDPVQQGVSYRYLYENGSDRNTLAVSYLANYTRTFREVHLGLGKLQDVVAGNASIEVGQPKRQYYNFGLTKASKSSGVDGSYMVGYQELIGFENSDLPTVENDVITVYKDLSDLFYGLYSESPFYYFNANIRDQANSAGTGYLYDFNALDKGKQEGSNGQMNSIAKMFLQDNQAYFFNMSDNAGDGYGELRDFTNMHDFFYFVIPYLREGVELARLYDDVFGLYTDDDCSLIVNADGSCIYDGKTFNDLTELDDLITSGSYTDEELYKLWHTYNTYTILSAYAPWVDTLLDCDYSKSETITVMGDRFRVADPLNPRTYYNEEGGKIKEGRYMIFSRSEMNAMGLTTADLTTVERKIIQFQDNVYNNAINLMNYYTFSDEVMVQAYAMLQTFEFNKLFSQTSVIGDSYVMYPQGYELKAFSYDAYLRMIVSNASGESLMYNKNGNVSIYERVMKNTSLFFGIFLLINDILAVYVIPGLKIFFLVVIFFCSILILIGSVIKMEMNIISVLWKSLFAPLLSFSAVCIGMSLIVSMFMKTGANGVASSEFIISVGDPTSAIILMIVLNVGVVILMFKICKKCFRDFITYARAVFDNIGSTVVGAVGAVGAGFAAGRAMDRFKSGGSEGGSGVSRTAKQRGRDNDPRSGRSGVGSALAAGAGGAALGAAAAGVAGAGGSSSGMEAGAEYNALNARDKRRLNEGKSRAEDTAGMNKYDRKAYEGATAKLDSARDKAARDKQLADNSKGLRQKRYQLAQKMHERQANSAEIKADNIKKYGTGFRGNGIRAGLAGMSTIAGEGRRTRLEGIHKDQAARVKAREGQAQAALDKQYAAQAQPMIAANASEMAKMTKELKKAQGRSAGAIIAANRSRAAGDGQGRTTKKGSQINNRVNQGRRTNQRRPAVNQQSRVSRQKRAQASTRKR